MPWLIGILSNEADVPTCANSTLHARCGQTDSLCNLHLLNIKNDIAAINAKTTNTFTNTINISPNQNKWLVENQESNDLNDNLNCPVEYWQRMNKLATTIVIHIYIIIFDTAWVDGTHLFHILSLCVGVNTFGQVFVRVRYSFFPSCMRKLFSYG